MTTITIIDLETTGLDPTTAKVCEYAILDFSADAAGITGRRSEVINPGIPIPPEASAVHHLTDVDVACGRSWEESKAELFAHPTDYWCAHNAKFERMFFDPPGSQWIDTYKVGVTLWPECPKFTVQCLRYFLKLKLADPAAAVPHRAAGDVYVTGAILRRAFSSFVITPDEMLAISNAPAILPRLHFGQHARKPLAEVPTSYLEWMSRQVDMDEDAVATARHHIALRRSAERSRSPVQLTEPGP